MTEPDDPRIGSRRSLIRPSLRLFSFSVLALPKRGAGAVDSPQQDHLGHEGEYVQERDRGEPPLRRVPPTGHRLEDPPRQHRPEHGADQIDVGHGRVDEAQTDVRRIDCREGRAPPPKRRIRRCSIGIAVAPPSIVATTVLVENYRHPLLHGHARQLRAESLHDSGADHRHKEGQLRRPVGLREGVPRDQRAHRGRAPDGLHRCPGRHDVHPATPGVGASSKPWRDRRPGEGARQPQRGRGGERSGGPLEEEEGGGELPRSGADAGQRRGEEDVAGVLGALSDGSC
mmetsp:Transcript_55468/g.117946  ORF Transcript_55468/g.117946 Transcript_55468/m.117946 type:complete len:286 (-) Transcript_55468:330-1187(-)